MEKVFKASENLRGTRYDIVLSKEVRGMPGFAPDFREIEVCHICVKYLEGEAPFVQFFNEPPNLEIAEIKEILELLERGFIKKDFQDIKLKNNG